MSYLVIYAFDRGGNAKSYGEVKNSWGGAMHIWNSLSKKYGVPFDTWSPESIAFWKLADSPQTSQLDNITLKFTYDRVWVKRENIPRLIEALTAFCEEFVFGKGIVDTLPQAIKILNKAKDDKKILGVAFNQTSVNEGHWFKYCEEKDEDQPYNINTGTSHWELLDLAPEDK